MRRDHPRYSPRQLDIAQRLADGSSTREVAAELHLAWHTIRKQCAWLRIKTNRHTTTGAIAVLIREGWID